MEESENKKYGVIFRCSVPRCTYASKRLYNVQRHEKTHSREHWRSKRFPCPCCAYAAATRTHLKRHMGNKHPAEDFSKHKITVLAYEDFAPPDEDVVKSDSTKKEPIKERIRTKKVENQAPLTGDVTQVVEGPVTVLQLVTPLKSQTMPELGDVYCYMTLEGEASRLIPVELLPAETIRDEL